MKQCESRDEVAEWLRRWTANPMGSARVGSNPILVEFFFAFSLLKTQLGALLQLKFWPSRTSGLRGAIG